MALGSTAHVFEIALSDVDRGVYDALTVRVARHPSESVAWLVARVLAYALEVQEGLAFSQGLGAGEEPALWVKDLTGATVAWIDVGTPAAERLHRASKAVERVVVYCHKDVGPWLRTLAGQRVYAPDRVRLVELDRKLVDALAERVERRTAWEVSVAGGELYVATGDLAVSAPLTEHAWPT